MHESHCVFGSMPDFTSYLSADLQETHILTHFGYVAAGFAERQRAVNKGQKGRLGEAHHGLSEAGSYSIQATMIPFKPCYRSGMTIFK